MGFIIPGLTKRSIVRRAISMSFNPANMIGSVGALARSAPNTVPADSGMTEDTATEMIAHFEPRHTPDVMSAMSERELGLKPAKISNGFISSTINGCGRANSIFSPIVMAILSDSWVRMNLHRIPTLRACTNAGTTLCTY
jgi:hypothetical protein